MRRCIPFLLTAALLCALCAPALAVDNPAFSVKLTGTLDADKKWNSQDTLVLDWQIMANRSGLTLNSAQGLRLAYDSTVLQLMRWDGSGVIDGGGVGTTFAIAFDAEEAGVYAFNVMVYAARDASGGMGYVSLALGSANRFYLCPQGTYVSLEKVRLAFRAGKSAADLTRDSIRLMTVEELYATNQSNAVMLTTNENGGKTYQYRAQKSGVSQGSDTLNPPEFSYPGSNAGAQGPTDPTGPIDPGDPTDPTDPGGSENPPDPPKPGFVNPYIDVKANDWYYPAVQFATENGLMNGTSASRFSPNSPMTREMFATVLHRLAGKPQTEGGSLFADVPDGQWYSDAVTWAKWNEIIMGYVDHRFGVGDNVTREQVVTILHRYADMRGLDVSGQASLSQYADAAKISVWAQTAMAWAIDAGVMSGRPGAILAPLENMTRAEVAQILLNFSQMS